MVVGEGFEPSKASPTDLQSVPFDRSGTPPLYYKIFLKNGANERTRTPDQLITNQRLYQLSYIGELIISKSRFAKNMPP